MVADSYKTLRVSVRPPRVVCLVNSNDEYWQERVLIALESFSRMWGGAGFIIVPTDGQTISKPFWQILMSYDPDYIWDSYLTNDNYERPLSLSNELLNQLKLRLAPFHHDDSRHSEQLKQEGFLQNLLIRNGTYPNFRAKYPFTDTTVILPNCEHSNKLAEVSNLQGIMQIWVGATTGVISSKYKDDLKEMDVETISFDYSENQSSLFDLVVKGVQRELAVDDAVFPFTFAKSNLGFFRSLEFSHWTEATLVIVGGKLEDFCLYFCLSRMRLKVAWLLPDWLPTNLSNEDRTALYGNNSLSSFYRALKNLERETQNGATYFMSSSYNQESLENVRGFFRDSYLEVGNGLLLDSSELSITSEQTESLSKSIEFLLRFPSRVFERENFERIISKHFIGSDMAGFFEPPKPKNFTQIDKNHHWVTDFSIVRQQFPRHPLLGVKIVREPVIFESNARVGKDSIAFVDSRTGIINDDMDAWLRKPEIYLPSAYNIFELIFQRNGYQTTFSDKGIFALTTISKFGSLSALANFAVTTKGRVFNRYILDEKLNPTDGGLFLSDKRWYLNFQSFKELLRDDITVSTLIYYLLGISVLHRGLIFKCELCKNTDWYSTSEITTEFQCKRCSLKQTPLRFHSLNQTEPIWYYKLDEVVYQAIRHNSIVPIIALNSLMQSSKAFDYCPELELRDLKIGEQSLEIDICCIQDGKLIIGEAKTADCLASTAKEENRAITKYYELAEKIGASQVVFATAKEKWQARTVERIVNRFSRSLTKVIFLTDQRIHS